jgi:hypothetical protein
MQTWTTIKVKLDLDKKERGRFPFMDYTVDSSGNVLDQTEYNEDASVACKRIYRYFDDGTVSEYVEYDPKDELIERHIYVENDSGEIDKVIYEFGNTEKIVKQFSYSDLGSADSAILYDENGEIIGRETYVLDDDGEITEQIEANAANVETIRITRSYDDLSNPVEESKFTDGRLTETTSSTYGANGKVERKVTSYKGHGYQIIDEYKYDAAGNMIHNVSFHNDFLVFENKCEYDENNNLITEEFYEIDYWEKRVTRNEKLIHLIKT